MKKIIEVNKLLKLTQLAAAVNGCLIMQYAGPVFVREGEDATNELRFDIDNGFDTGWHSFKNKQDWEYYSYKEIQKLSTPKIMLIGEGIVISIAAARRILKAKGVKE